MKKTWKELDKKTKKNLYKSYKENGVFKKNGKMHAHINAGSAIALMILLFILAFCLGGLVQEGISEIVEQDLGNIVCKELYGNNTEFKEIEKVWEQTDNFICEQIKEDGVDGTNIQLRTK